MDAYRFDFATELAEDHIKRGMCDIYSIIGWCYHNERPSWEMYMEWYVTRFNSQAQADFLAQPH